MLKDASYCAVLHRPSDSVSPYTVRQQHCSSLLRIGETASHCVLQAMSTATLSGRVSSRLTAGSSRRPSIRVAASSDVAPNVAEARAWIAAWRSKQGRMAPPAEAAAPAPAPTPTNGKGKSKTAATAVAPVAAAAPPAAKAAPAKSQSKFGPSKSFDDGTLVFTADQLTAVKYTDVKLKK